MKFVLLFLMTLILSCKYDTKFSINEKKYTIYNNCFVVDYSLKSNNKRFLVILNNTIVDSFLVCNGKSDFNGSPIFSNIQDSNTSSLGKIEIMYSYIGNYGKAYKLKGLEKTNDNIFKRHIVLHSHSCVPDDTDYPICESQGCPTVSKNSFKIIDKYIQEYNIKYIYVII